MKKGKLFDLLDGNDQWTIVCSMLIVTACLKMAYALQDIANISYFITLGTTGIYVAFRVLMTIKEIRNGKIRLNQCKLDIVLFLILLCFAISLAFNWNEFWIRNARALISGVIFFFVLFSKPKSLPVCYLEKNIHIFDMLVIWITFFESLISCLFIFSHTTLFFENFSHSFFEIGWSTERIQGIYGNGNAEGIAGVISFTISIIEIVFSRLNKRKASKIIYANIIVQVIAILVSASRSCFIGIIFVIGASCLVHYCVQNEHKIKGTFKTIIVTFIASMLLLSIGSIVPKISSLGDIREYLVSFPEKKIERIRNEQKDANVISIADRILTGKQTIVNDGNGQQNSEDNSLQEDEKGIGSLNDYSSGRIQIWEGGLKVFKNHLMWGGGLYGLENYLYEETEFFDNYDSERIEQIKHNYYSMHNDYLQAFVSTGLLGGTLYNGLILYLAVYGVVLFFRSREQEDREKKGYLLVLIGVLLLQGMFSYIFYFDAIATGTIFWLYFGILLAYNFPKDFEDAKQ